MHDLSQAFDQASDLHRKGELAAAESLYLQLLKARPDHFDGLQMLGLLRYQQGRFLEALALIGAALKTNPESPPALLNYAVVLDTLQRREEALAYYDKALAIKPDYAEALFNRGIALRYLKRPAEALASFERMLALRPDDADAHDNRGSALRDLKRPAEAVASYDRALALRPRDADVLNNRGNALRDLELTAAALASYDQALAVKPDHLEALKNRASALRSLKRPADALAGYDKALAIKPNDAGAFYNRGNALQDLKRPAEALASFERALAIRPGYVEALNNRGSALQDLKRPAEALASFERALAIKPDYAEARNNRGNVLGQMGRHRDAINDFDRAIALRPDFAAAFSNKANSLFLLGRYDEALAVYDKVLALKPDSAEAWLGRGNILNCYLARRADALVAFDKALAAQPDLADAWGGRGEALAELGRPQEAVVAYRQALASGGDAEAIRYALASLGVEAAPATAPKEYVTKLFDQYAGHFDEHLVGKLKYRTPDCLFDAIKSFVPTATLDILDLGCGTGLAGSRLRPRARTLTGIDISSRMLEVARERQIYDNLVCSELIEFLPTQSGKFDLVVAADVFIYIGDLSAVFHGVRAALRDGGVFGFSVEISEDRDFVLRATRRYAHSKAYLRRLAQDHGFTVETIEPQIIRQQSGIDVAGYIAVLRCSRPGSAPDLKQPAEALASHGRAPRAQPDHARALYNRAGALRDLQRPAEALAAYDEALLIKPDYAEAFNNRGLALLDLQRPAEALASFERALQIRPDYARALNNLGNTLQALQRPAEALASYDRLLAFQPAHAGALYNRGIVLRELRRPAEALTSFERALSIDPNHVDALNNRGIVLRDLGRPLEALASYDQALSIDPDNAETHSNRGCLRLLLGDFGRGWEEFEWRWRVRDFAPWRREFAQPLWLGDEPLAGRTILLHAEQGFGDAIHFVRYASLVAARGAKVVLEVPPPLTALLARIEGASLVVGRGEKLPRFDCHCPLLSLPLAFKTRLDTIPTAIPYLSAPEDRIIKWKQRLPQSGMRRIGIAWAGNPNFKGDQTRSIGLARFSPLLSLPGIAFLSLQKDLRDGDRDILRNNSHVIHLGDAIADFGDTAAIMSLLDLVITSDTSVAHLAGALGKPVWVLLQYVADWRWLLDRSDSPWYPAARLFRQPEIDDWESVIGQVKDALARA